MALKNGALVAIGASILHDFLHSEKLMRALDMALIDNMSTILPITHFIEQLLDPTSPIWLTAIGTTQHRKQLPPGPRTNLLSNIGLEIQAHR